MPSLSMPVFLQSTEARSRVGWQILRMILAGLIAAHGWARLLAGGVPPFGEFLALQGFPAGLYWAAAVTGTEIIGSALLLAGRFTAFLALLFSAIYALGIALVHAKAGWFVVGLGRNGAEYSVLMIGCLLLLALQAAPIPSRNPAMDKVRQLFTDAGLSVPALPKPLADLLREQESWVFATRDLPESPYHLQYYVDEASAPVPYAVLSHSGHGTNSYAIQYYMVTDSIRLFLHLSWGGVYMDADASAAQIASCFALADQIVAKAARGHTGPLLVVACDTYGSYWGTAGDRSDASAPHSKAPSEVLSEALAWCEDSWTG